MENSPEIYSVFLGPLEKLGLPYFVTGSVASSAYGEPRFTQDLDLVLALRIDAVNAFVQAFPGEQYYCPPGSTLLEEAERVVDGHFNLIHHELGVRADIYLAGDDALHSWAFDHRRRLVLSGGSSVWFAPPEYVILRKLEYMAEGAGDRHVGDIRAMLQSLGGDLDAGFMDDWIRRHGLLPLWDRVRG